MSKSMVRLALVVSVARTSPPVRFHSSQLSMVPSARSGPAGTPPPPAASGVRSQAIFVPLK